MNDFDPQFETLLALRKAGYAVVCIAPEEMRGVPRRLVESRLAELGMEAIEDLSNAEESK
jgi:hypothetical protein